MTPTPLDVHGTVDVQVGAAHLEVRGSGPRVEIRLPAPWHWPRLLRASKPLVDLVRASTPFLERGNVEVRLRYGPFSKAVGRARRS